jgi:hypothetical protein
MSALLLALLFGSTPDAGVYISQCQQEERICLKDAEKDPCPWLERDRCAATLALCEARTEAAREAARERLYRAWRRRCTIKAHGP